jgi:hypothetical protein
VILAALAGTLAGSAGAGIVRGRTDLATWPGVARARLSALALPLIGLAAGALAARAMADPAVAPLGAALAWGGGELLQRTAAERRLLSRTREALPLLTRLEQEVQAGAHPVAALAWAARSETLPTWLGTRLDGLAQALGRGEPLARAAQDWAAREEVPLLRMFAHLLSLDATWGGGLGPALRRLLREAEQSVAFGAEERSEHRLYEVLTLAFLAVDLVVGIAALSGWPAGVPGPVHTAWGHALLLGSALTTAAAVAGPVALGASSPPRLHALAPSQEDHGHD